MAAFLAVLEDAALTRAFLTGSELVLKSCVVAGAPESCSFGGVAVAPSGPLAVPGPLLDRV